MIRGVQDPTLSATVTESRPLAGVRAGSALLAVDGRLLAVGDDAYAVTWVDGETTGDPTPHPKITKPDFEAAAVTPDGEVWLLGSGSLPQRRQVLTLEGTPAFDAQPMYAALEAHLGEAPNIEGAVFQDGALNLFHRAVGTQSDVWFTLAADHTVAATRGLTLGELSGIPLHVTDVATLPDGSLAFLAAAEDTADAVLDGPVAGSVIGVLEGYGARWTPLGPFKAEGLAITPDGIFVVTDADDAAAEALLLRVEVAGKFGK